MPQAIDVPPEHQWPFAHGSHSSALAMHEREEVVPGGHGVASGEPNGQYVAGPQGVGDSVAPGQNAPAGHGPEQAEELWSATTSAP